MASFTALNGVDSKTPDDISSSSPKPRRIDSEDRSTGTTSQEPNSGDTSVARVEKSAGSSIERPHYSSKSYNDVEITHKRKRSASIERSREATNTLNHDQRSQGESRGGQQAPPRDREYRHYKDDQREHGESWYSRDGRNLYEARDPSGPGASNTDEQAGEPRRRAPSHTESAHEYSATSPDGDESSMLYNGSYQQDQSKDPVIQSDPKKRKRNFSCLTCRKRKKKCDESKPECTNCVRGGFVCYGYPNQRGPPRLENKPAAVPLESKDPSYVPPGAYGMPQPNPYSNPPPAPVPGPKRDSVSSYRGPYLRLETSQARSVLSEDDRPTASTIQTPSAVSSVLSPENKSSAFSAYTNPANMFPTPISAITPSIQQLKTPNIERPRDYQRVPPLHDITRTDPDTSQPGTPRLVSLPQMNVLEPAPTPKSQPPPTTDPQMAAKLALSRTSYSSNSKPRTQKEEMLLGREYNPFDRELVQERQRCSAACWRFNNSTNPNTGVSSTERSRLFREILNPPEPIYLSPPAISSTTTRTGCVGQEVVVEAPFTCDYGYNITIGNNVLIGRNCTIIDPMEIRIGDNCFIGPNVTLLGATTLIDPKKRMGSRSPQIGGYITIHEDVNIGAGAIIQHGIQIGKGASISAGAVVVKDVPRYTIVAGNPAEVKSLIH
ncbi:hypothetical protein GGR50DRAFT_690532 [Xylaria sp. CBS 124048]|nr:hypothetical protein GGR50DRAFT_690532 [Xylaria sp. CBS 124048]